MELIDTASVERLTGVAFFTPAGAAASIPLGNIELMRLDYGLKSFDVMRSRRGIVSPRKRHFYQRSPIFTLQGDQFATARMALQLAGTRQLPNFAQSYGNNVYVFTAIPGGAFLIDRSGLFNVTVVVQGNVKQVDYDYFIDTYNGWIWLPEVGGTILAGDTVTVNYSITGQAWEVYIALDTLSRDGQLIVYAEDHLGPPAREQWVMDVTLSVKGMPDTDPARFRVWTIEALILGNPTVFKRPQQQAWTDFGDGSGAILQTR